MKTICRFRGHYLKLKENLHFDLKKSIVEYLKTCFAKHPYPTEEEQDAIVHLTGLSNFQVKTWFVRRRQKERIASKKQNVMRNKILMDSCLQSPTKVSILRNMHTP